MSKFKNIKLCLLFFSLVETCALCAQKNCLIETILWSSYNICVVEK